MACELIGSRGGTTERSLAPSVAPSDSLLLKPRQALLTSVRIEGFEELADSWYTMLLAGGREWASRRVES